jgi:hypothetical protein
MRKKLTMSKVWEDEKGIYVRAGGYIARPGNVAGHDHGLRMDSAGLEKGDTVDARHVAGTQLTVIYPPKGKKFRPVPGDQTANDPKIRPYINQDYLTWHHDGGLQIPKGNRS